MLQEIDCGRVQSSPAECNGNSNGKMSSGFMKCTGNRKVTRATEHHLRRDVTTTLFECCRSNPSAYRGVSLGDDKNNKQQCGGNVGRQRGEKGGPPAATALVKTAEGHSKCQPTSGNYSIRPEDSSTPHGDTAVSTSLSILVKKNAPNRRIIYDAQL